MRETRIKGGIKMLYGQIKRRLENNQKGTFTSMVWERPVKTKKAFADNIITKRSEGVVRLGVEYDNMKDVKEKRMSGELPASNEGLQWGTWAEYPYIIEHKGNKYLRCATSQNNKIKTKYFVNGKETPFEDIENMVLASEKKKTDELDVFSVNIDNIIALG